MNHFKIVYFSNYHVRTLINNYNIILRCDGDTHCSYETVHL